MTTTHKDFKLTPKQTEVIENLLSNDKPETLLYGGGRSAKTFLLLYTLIIRALKEPNSNHLIARKTFQSVKETIWFKTWEDVIKIAFPPDFSLHIKDNKDLWFKEFPNGSRVHFHGLDDNERVDKVLGNEYSTIFLNEVTQIGWEAVETVKSRLAERNGLTNKIFYDCNPTNSSHWTYQVFIKHRSPETGKPLENPDDYQHTRMNPQDNLDNIDPNYIKRMENASEAKRRRFLLGEFAVGEDVAVYKEEWIHYWTQLPPTNYIVWSWDTAQKDKEYNDPTGGTAWAVTDNGYYLIDIINEKMDYPSLRERVINTAEDRNAALVLIEDKSSGTSLIQDLRHHTRVPVQPFDPGNTPKIKRAMYSSHLFEQKKVFLPQHHELVDEYRAQLLMFPLGEHDDLVDSTSQFLAYAKDELMYSLPDSVYELDEDYIMDYPMEENRNPHTGY